MKIYFHTFGCKVNQYETQLLREQLENANYKTTEYHINANIAIINSCTVTHNADADCRQIIRRILRTNPECRIIVTGCYAISSPEEIKAISPLVEVIENKNQIPNLLSNIHITHHISHITQFYKHSRAFVKIQDGCDAFCSYCIVPYVRPKLWSKPKEIVFKEIQALLENGYKKIVLCGIRLGKYRDNGSAVQQSSSNSSYGLVELVKDILTEKSIQLEFSSLELQEISDELIELIATSDRIVRHLHIPLQSANNEILKLMHRPYTVEEFQLKLNLLRSKIPDISITTDIMVGFPGETQKQFENTVEFIKKNRFTKFHLFRYSVRNKTQAAKLPNRISSQEIKFRAKTLLEFSRNY